MNGIGDDDWKFSLTYLIIIIAITAIMIITSVNGIMLADAMLAKQKAKQKSILNNHGGN